MSAPDLIADIVRVSDNNVKGNSLQVDVPPTPKLQQPSKPQMISPNSSTTKLPMLAAQGSHPSQQALPSSPSPPGARPLAHRSPQDTGLGSLTVSSSQHVPAYSNRSPTLSRHASMDSNGLSGIQSSHSLPLTYASPASSEDDYNTRVQRIPHSLSSNALPSINRSSDNGVTKVSGLGGPITPGRPARQSEPSGSKSTSTHTLVPLNQPSGPRNLVASLAVPLGASPSPPGNSPGLQRNSPARSSAPQLTMLPLDTSNLQPSSQPMDLLKGLPVQPLQTARSAGLASLPFAGDDVADAHEPYEPAPPAPRPPRRLDSIPAPNINGLPASATSPQPPATEPPAVSRPSPTARQMKLNPLDAHPVAQIPQTPARPLPKTPPQQPSMRLQPISHAAGELPHPSSFSADLPKLHIASDASPETPTNHRMARHSDSATLRSSSNFASALAKISEGNLSLSADLSSIPNFPVQPPKGSKASSLTQEDSVMLPRGDDDEYYTGPSVLPPLGQDPAITTVTITANDATSKQTTVPKNQDLSSDMGDMSGAGTGGCKVICVSANLPSKMQRNVWSLKGFRVTERLHKGYASSVYKAVDLQSREVVALKVYRLRDVNPYHLHQLFREIQVHSCLYHPNIVHLFAAFQEANRIILVQEFAAGGDLFSYVRRNGGCLPHKKVVDFVLAPLVSALHYMHARSIVHRDIKPENLLITTSGQLKLADFGVAIDLRQERAVTRTGTLDYMAPEVAHCPLKRHPEDNKQRPDLAYNCTADCWSVGVLAYELVVGTTPFPHTDQQNQSPDSQEDDGRGLMRVKTTPPPKKELYFPADIPVEARRFIRAALNENPRERPTAEDMAKHPWIMANSKGI